MPRLEARLTRLEQAAEARALRRMYRLVAAEFGMDADDLQRDCEQFLSMSLEAQLAEVDRIAALAPAPDEAHPPDFDEIRRVLTEASHR